MVFFSPLKLNVIPIRFFLININCVTSYQEGLFNIGICRDFVEVSSLGFDRVDADPVANFKPWYRNKQIVTSMPDRRFANITQKPVTFAAKIFLLNFSFKSEPSETTVA